MPWRQWANRPLMERGWIFFCASYSATISPCAEVSDAPDAPDTSDATGVIGMPGLRSGGSPHGCMVLLPGLVRQAPDIGRQHADLRLGQLVLLRRHLVDLAVVDHLGNGRLTPAMQPD